MASPAIQTNNKATHLHSKHLLKKLIFIALKKSI